MTSAPHVRTLRPEPTGSRLTGGGFLPRRVIWSFGLVAAVVSSLGSWIPSLWGDEAASVLSATRSIPSLFRMLGHVDAVHGTYYLGLHFWIDVFGASPFSVRVPPALAVGLAVVAVVYLAELIGGRRLAIIAGVVCCIVPRVTYMGEETRSYAFSAAFAAWLMLLLVQLIVGRKSGLRWWIVYGALLAGGVYMFFYFGLFVIAHAVVLVASRVTSSTWKKWALAVVAAMVVASPVIAFALLEKEQVAFLADRNTTSFTALVVGLWFQDTLFAVVAWVLIGVAAVAWVRRILLAGRGGAERSRPTSPTIELIGFVWLLVPPVVLLATHYLIVPDFSGRYMSMCAPAAALLIAAGIDALAGRRTVVVVVLTAMVVAAAVPTYLSQRTPYAKNQSDWAEISSTVGAHARPGSAVVFDETIQPSRRTRLAMHIYPAGFRNLTDVALKIPYSKNKTWYDSALTVPQALAAGRFDGFRDVWVVEYRLPGHSDTYGLAALEAAGYTVEDVYTTHRSEILHLVR
jgi:mannosyltransferase